MSLRTKQVCPHCNSIAIGLFPQVSVNCQDHQGQGEVVGGLEASLYTCAECGFSELFLRQPLRSWTQTPAEADLAFEWVRPPGDTPYR